MDIREISSLSEIERAVAEVAIAANPNRLISQPCLTFNGCKACGPVLNGLDAMPDTTVEIVRLTHPQFAETMSEAVLSWTLYLHRDMPRYAAQQRLAK